MFTHQSLPVIELLSSSLSSPSGPPWPRELAAPPPDTTPLYRKLPALATSILPQQTGCPVLESITAFSESVRGHSPRAAPSPRQSRAGPWKKGARGGWRGGGGFAKAFPQRYYGLNSSSALASRCTGVPPALQSRRPQPPPAPSPFSLPGPSSINPFHPNLNPIPSGSCFSRGPKLTPCSTSR